MAIALAQSSMEEREGHLIVIIGASATAETLRRSLARCGKPHAGVASHLRGLRRTLVLGTCDLVTICIALDETTLTRHGESIRQLTADQNSFASSIRCIGLLNDETLTRSAAELGCDVFVRTPRQAAKAARMLASQWQRQRIKQRQRDIIKVLDRSDRARIADRVEVVEELVSAEAMAQKTV